MLIKIQYIYSIVVKGNFYNIIFITLLLIFTVCRNAKINKFFYYFSAVCVLVIACRRVSMFCKMKYSIFFSAVSQNAMVVRRRVFFSYRMPPCVNICQNVKFNKFVINHYRVCISVTVCRFFRMPNIKSIQDLSLSCVL